MWVCGGGTNVSYSCRCESIIHEMFRPGSHFFGGGDHHQAGSVLVVVSRAILNERGARASDERRGRGLFGFMFGGDMIGYCVWHCPVAGDRSWNKWQRMGTQINFECSRPWSYINHRRPLLSLGSMVWADLMLDW